MYTCKCTYTYPPLPLQEEDLHNKMNENRRRTNLEKKLQFLEKEIDRQEKAKTGVEQLAKVYQEQPDFVDEKGADDVTRELAEVGRGWERRGKEKRRERGREITWCE